MADDTIIYCANAECLTPIGHYVEIGGKTYLETDTMIVEDCYAFCKRCRVRFGWHMSDQLMAKIIQRKKAVNMLD